VGRGNRMKHTCPLCNGAKVISKSNGCEESKEYQVCNVCKGLGEVEEQRIENKPIVIYKYWGTFATK